MVIRFRNAIRINRYRLAGESARKAVSTWLPPYSANGIGDVVPQPNTDRSERWPGQGPGHSGQENEGSTGDEQGAGDQ